MAFNRFFGRGRDTTPAPPPRDDLDALGHPEPATDDDEPLDTPEDAPERGWRERAEAVLPTGASTGSKRTEALYGVADADGPTHFVSARGCRLTAVDGERYLDCTMALGAVALGYAEPKVTQAVIEAASQGPVSALSSWREVELAERLCAMIPCAERAQLLKTAADVASGYFGWHDWSSDAAGVPAGTKRDVTRVPFDDVAALERAVAAAGTGLAAIVLEPVVEREPSAEWLARARALCDSTGAALIFDEVKTGFRVAPGGYQEVCGVTPDLAAFGKAMANGYPLAAVVGAAPLMESARRTWISSTLASEATALAAALAVLDWHEAADIPATLAETGREMRAAVDRAIDASGLHGVQTVGVDTMWLLRWDDPIRESRFLLHAVREGVLFKRGAYNFAAVAHDEEALREIEAAASAALVALGEEEA
jgi:glutamate-1-semialdehyde 2,1-aminomutase